MDGTVEVIAAADGFSSGQAGEPLTPWDFRIGIVRADFMEAEEQEDKNPGRS